MVRQIERRLFSALYQITQARSQNNILTLIIMVLYLLELLFSFSIFMNPSSNISQIIATSFLIKISVAALSLIIIIELIVAMAYRVQIQLVLQLMVFRYILFPLGLLMLISEIQEENLLSRQASVTIYIFLTIITYFINFLIHLQSNSNLFRVFQKSSNWFIITDNLFYLIKLPNSIILIEINVISILFFNLLTRYQLKDYKLSSKTQQFQYFSLIIKDFLIAIFLVSQALLFGSDSIQMIILSFPLLLIAFIYELTKKTEAVLKSQVFSAQATIEQFFDFINVMGQELTKFKNNQDLDFQRSLLLVFVAVHKTKCHNFNCLLLQKSTEEELKNKNQANNLNIIKYKVIKKMEFLFEVYEQKQYDNVKLKLLLIDFYMNHLPNKPKMSYLISSIRNMPVPLSWNERLIFYRLKKKVEKIQIVEELISVSKNQDDYIEFKKLMSNTVSCFLQFWGQILQERVDLNQLMSISKKLFPLKNSIEQTWKKHLNKQKFTSWNIMKTYTYYRRKILHDYTNSIILEDYCRIMQCRLKNKHEMSYINSQTDQAVITISLTQSSFGNISSLNNQTCKLFNFFSKSQMIDLRVNDIMPSVYSSFHDNILSSFLKNRFKSINQDLRFVFGKNKNGFIFPFFLQLRNISWNANDQLIFIANVVPTKIRNAPIYCISDLQGEIQDYTSTFAWLFMKKTKNNRQIKGKNIQQMIPSFFEVIERVQHLYDLKVKFEQKNFSHKNGQNIEIQFSASDLYIKQQKVGYLIEGINTQPIQALQDRNGVNQMLANFYRQNSAYVNRYNFHSKVYEIPNQTQLPHKIQQKKKNIPIVKKINPQKNVAHERQEVRYDKNIKTLRLYQGQLEHVDDQQSFNSQQDNFEMRQLSVIKKIEKMKEALNVEQRNSMGNYFKISVTIISAFIICFILFIFSRTSSFDINETQRLQQIEQRLIIRELFPQLIIYTYYAEISGDPSQRITSLRDQLKAKVIHSSIDQFQKEEIMQAIFSSQISTTLSLDPNILQFSYSQNLTYESISSIWYAVTVSSFLFILALLLIYLTFKFQISKIYIIFVSINQNKLLEVQQQAKKILDFISIHNIQEQKIENFQNVKKEEPEAQFQRAKKMKNDYTIQDLTSLAQLILPILVILSYSIFCSIYIQQNFHIYENYTKNWLECSKLLPQTSVSTMQALINRNQIGNITLSSQYFSIEQKFQYLIASQNFYSLGLLPIIQGDPCSNQKFYLSLSINITNFCNNSTVFLDYSIQNILNYISSVLKDESEDFRIQWSWLISIEFDLMKPILNYVTSKVGGQVASLRHTCEQNVIIFGAIYICLIIFAAVYIVCFPLSQIYDKLLFTTDLIKILPSDKEEQPEQALAAMTTQAMQTY